MAQDQGQFGVGQFPVHHVQVRAADPAGVDPDEHLLRTRLGRRHFPPFQGLPRLLQHHGPHLVGIFIDEPPKLN